MNRNDITIMKRRGKSSSVTDEHISFLTKWFEKQSNVGMPFKYAY